MNCTRREWRSGVLLSTLSPVRILSLPFLDASDLVYFLKNVEQSRDTNSASSSRPSCRYAQSSGAAPDGQEDRVEVTRAIGKLGADLREWPIERGVGNGALQQVLYASRGAPGETSMDVI